MADGHGGKRTPRQPAVASGPGSLSRRTDGGPAQVNAQLSNASYGEQTEFQEIQSGAPMAAVPMAAPVNVGSGGGGSTPLPPPLPLTAPTERPDEPISHGASFGPGPGPRYGAQSGRLSDTLARIMRNDPSGGLEDLYEIALRKGF